MIILKHVVGFDWDVGNERKSVKKHGVSKESAEQIFFNQPLLVIEDQQHSEMELRFHALGVTDSCRYLHITFTLRYNGTKIRVISARDMHRKERSAYEKPNQDS
ncbi:MAG: BrnT family toxin [Mariprofundales bacterium]